MRPPQDDATAANVAAVACPVNQPKAQYAALYFASESFRSFMIAAGSPPAFFTLSAQFFSSGSADLRHSASCASVIV